MVQIFGKDTCPYTQAALEDYRDRGVKVDYRNVKKDPAFLAEMLQLTNGRRDVPVIVDAGEVTIGFGGT
jgi:glutaredoxin 3